MSKTEEYISRSEKVILHTYNRFPVVLEKGDGVYLTDVEGKKYLDFGAGIAVFALGYHYQDYDEALKNQDAPQQDETVQMGAAASRLGEVIALHVIPRPHGDVEKLLPTLK